MKCDHPSVDMLLLDDDDDADIENDNNDKNH